MVVSANDIGVKLLLKNLSVVDDAAGEDVMPFTDL